MYTFYAGLLTLSLDAVSIDFMIIIIGCDLGDETAFLSSESDQGFTTNKQVTLQKQFFIM